MADYYFPDNHCSMLVIFLLDPFNTLKEHKINLKKLHEQTFKSIDVTFIDYGLDIKIKNFFENKYKNNLRYNMINKNDLIKNKVWERNCGKYIFITDGRNLKNLSVLQNKAKKFCTFSVFIIKYKIYFNYAKMTCREKYMKKLFSILSYKIYKR
ncbi:hypothetical protein MHBO_002537, partial [Bonamia ostreae]